MHLVTALALTFVAAGLGERGFLTLYKPLEFRYSGGRYENEVFHYRLLDPRVGDSQGEFPLIVWLHGFGEAGSDNVTQLHYLDKLVTPSPWQAERFPFFLLAVQSPQDNGDWGSGDATAEDEMASVIVRILEATLEDYPIDRQRIYVAGVSNGGGGCWRLASHWPEYFAAVAPLSGGEFTPTPSEISALTQMPIWVFNCTGDGGSPIDTLRDTVRTLKDAGARIHMSEIVAASHDSWTPAFTDYDLRGWLLAQRRGDSSAPPPGSLTWRQALIVFYHGHYCEVLRGWSWLQLSAFGYLTLVVAAIGGWASKGRRIIPKVRIRMWRSRKRAREG